jgi:anti-sigma factor RsiW
MQELLPWYVMGSLDDIEAALVRAHVVQCAACQEEVRWQETVKQAHAGVATESESASGFAALCETIALERKPQGWRNAARALGSAWRVERRWTGYALVILAVINIALVAALTFGAAQTAEYHALGRPPSDARQKARLVVQFRPDTSEAQLRQIFRMSQTRLVGGPTVTDGYLLGVDSQYEAQALEILRKQKEVLLVESLGPRSSP